MRKLVSIVLGTVMLSFGMSTAFAQTCDDVVWGSQVLSNFPDAASYCLSVVERDGSEYVKMAAEVQRAHPNGAVTLRFQHPDGSYGPTTYVKPQRDRMEVEVGGRMTNVVDLNRGQDIRLYVASDRWAFAQVPEDPTVQVITVAFVEEPIAAPAPMPTTASPLPLIGLLGGLFVTFGAGLTAIRRRLS